VFALVQKESLNSKNALEWVSQKLISAVLVLYAVSVMDGHSIMLGKWNNVQNVFIHKNTHMSAAEH